MEYNSSNDSGADYAYGAGRAGGSASSYQAGGGTETYERASNQRYFSSGTGNKTMQKSSYSYNDGGNRRPPHSQGSSGGRGRYRAFTQEQRKQQQQQQYHYDPAFAQTHDSADGQQWHRAAAGSSQNADGYAQQRQPQVGYSEEVGSYDNLDGNGVAGYDDAQWSQGGAGARAETHAQPDIDRWQQQWAPPQPQKRRVVPPSGGRGASSAPPYTSLPPSDLVSPTLHGQLRQQQQRMYSGNTSNQGSFYPQQQQQQVVTMPSSQGVQPGFPPVHASFLLEAIIENVMFFRHIQRRVGGLQLRPEVVLAFDEYLARGTPLLKFVPSGPPHERFFIICFLDLNSGTVAGSDALPTSADSTAPMTLSRNMASKSGASGVPEAVFCWRRHANSHNIRRFFPLSDLVSVTAGGRGHKYVERRLSHSGVLKGARSGLSTKYIKDEYILQFRFQSSVSLSEEVVAVKAPNPTIFLAWQVFGDYISQLRA